MRPRNREINIFNLSMLDVICGSLGTFILLMIILLPYYKKDNINYQQEIQQIQQQLDVSQQQAQAALARASAAENQAQAALDRAQTAEQEVARMQNADQRTQETERQLTSARQAARDAEQRAARAEQMLTKTFLVVYIRWSTPNQDVDLHVVDPSGAEFFYQKKTFPGRTGELSEDSQVGPGNEVWEIKDAPSGRYEIYANLFARRGNTANPTVKGRIFFRDGSKPLPEIVLTEVKTKKPIGVVAIKDDGTVQFSW
jgi:uncharacterized protein YfaP (DUF2135 family)